MSSMLRPIVIIFCLAFTSNSLLGQSKYFDSLARAKYIERFPDYFFIWPVLRQRASSFIIQNSRNAGDRLTFSPNITNHAGLGFYVFEIGFQFIVAIPPSQKSINEFGESNSLDLQANIIGNNWEIDAFHENYKGYFADDSRNPIPSGVPKLQRRDIETVNSGFTGAYFFNKRRFSIRATYNFYERQKKSAGSPMLLANFTQFSLRSDSALYRSTQFNANDIGDFKDIDYRTISIAPGYAYNLVLRNFFVGASLNIGASFQFFNYRLGVDKNYSMAVVPYVNGRTTIGFNSDRFFTGITYTFQTLQISYSDADFINRADTFRLIFGYRFREVGFLKLRALEMIKPKSR
ncbi:MAG: DUF4421 domain-containing protein [Flammeovirgaceae bacterium]|nr:DUF4421 domain-containing protein [Flammeovirgaceae bacterium]